MSTGAGSATATLPMGEIRVPLEQIRPSPLNPRKSVDPKKLEELTASVRASGILQALLVRPLPSSAWRTPTTPMYEIVFGERRYRAAKTAGLPEIPAKVQDLTDAQVLQKQIEENDQREDVHPLDQGEGYRKLLKVAGIDVDELVKWIGKSRSYIYQRLKLAELNETAKQAFRAGELTASHAILLARLSPKDQTAALKATIREEEVPGRDGRDQGVKGTRSVRELEAWIATNVHLNLTKAPFPTDDPKLLPSAGACGPCPKRAANLTHLEPELAAKRPDTCTDHSCYDAKVARWLEARVADALLKTRAAGAPGAGRKVVRLSDEYFAKTPNALGTKDWQRAATGDCPARALGVVVEASTRGYGNVHVKLGEILPVCLAKHKRCKAHNPVEVRKASPDAKRHREAVARERAKRAGDRAGRLRVSTAVLAAAGQRPALTLPEWRALAAEVTESAVDFEDVQDVAAILYGPPRPTKHGWAGRTLTLLDAKTKTLTVEGCQRHLLACALSGALDLARRPRGKGDPLLEAARARKLNVAALLKAPPAKAVDVPRGKTTKGKTVLDQVAAAARAAAREKPAAQARPARKGKRAGIKRTRKGRRAA